MQEIKINESDYEVFVNGTVNLESVPKDKLDDFVNALVMAIAELNTGKK